MSFKNKFLTKLFLVFLALGLLNHSFAALTPDEIRFINSRPIVPQLEEISYSGPAINSSSAYSVYHYKKEELKSLSLKLSKRIQLSIDYRNKGDIGQFSEILIDIITQNYFTEESAWAAILLGDFEVSLYNLEEAFKYYIYAANIHYRVGFGLASRLKLGILLDGMGHFEKAEEVIREIINTENNSNPIVASSKNYIKTRYLEKARWHLSKNELENAEKYFMSYKAYENPSVLKTQ